MDQLNSTLALHLNELTLNELPEVRQAFRWFSKNVKQINNLHLLHLRPRMPAQAMCISSAESLYFSEYQAAQAQVVAWRDLLCIPQCTGWLHEGASLELRSFCKQHQFNYLLTSLKTAQQIQAPKLYWRRHQTKIVETFDNLALIALNACTMPMMQKHQPAQAMAVGC